MNIKKIITLVLSITTPTATIFSTISCGWTISPDKEDDLIKDKWNDIKFNAPVMPGWKDLNIVGNNEKEWKRLKLIYDKEIKNGEKQLDAIKQGLKEFNDLDEFNKTIGWLIEIMVQWYKQIQVEINYNLWLIKENLTFDKLLINNSLFTLNNAKKQLELITKDNSGLFAIWLINFNKWQKWMINTFNKKFSIKDRESWINVSNHLTNKKNQFQKDILKINEKIQRLQK